MSDERVGLMAEKSAWKASARRAERLTGLYSLLGLLLIPAFMIPAEWLASRLTAGLTQDLLASTFVAVVAAPMVLVMWRNGATQQGQTIRLMDELERQLTSALDDARSSAERREAQARRQEFETRLASALEMADGESEVIDVVERALTTTLPGAPAELLLADNSHAHLTRMAVSSGPGSASGPAGSLRRAGPMCGVDSPDHCPAARRSQVQHFGDSDALDACPKLQRRAEGRIAALCVPVSIMGRTVGVIHTTAEPQTRFEDEVVQDVSTLANLAGARLGLLRMVADTQLQAATDSLTGLLNRRSLENKVRALREADVSYTVVMADLDHFKHLNDTHGHETGDRALRLFARTLRASVRSQDLVSRHGGEEFAVVLAGCSAQDAHDMLVAVRTAITAALDGAGIPTLTASFGVVEAHASEELPTALARADAALFEAKRTGRDRIVVHDPAGRSVDLAPSPATVSGPRVDGSSQVRRPAAS